MRPIAQSDAELFYLTNGVVAQLGQACAEDEYKDPTTGECVPYWDPPEQAQCGEKEFWNPNTQKCEAYPDWLDPDVWPDVPPEFVAPGAVQVRPENWELDAEPYALYTLAWGDTYVGLSKTYLGDGARWPEIWDLNRATTPDPDKIGVGQVINMPNEARDKMRAWLKRGGKGLPGEQPEEPPLAEKAKKAAPYLLIGLAAAGLVYYVSQS